MTTLTSASARPSACAADLERSDDSTDAARLLPYRQLNARLRTLHNACELLADGFDELDEHIGAYVAATTFSPHESTHDDVERFVDWLGELIDLSDEQRDYVAALRCSNAVELVALRQRLAHARFQELLSMNGRLLRELESNPRLSIHLNPIHVWSQFETRALLDQNADVPATVVFFPAGGAVRVVVMEPETEETVRDLEQCGPTTIADLLRRTPRGERHEQLNRIRKLAGVGLIACG